MWHNLLAFLWGQQTEGHRGKIEDTTAIFREERLVHGVQVVAVTVLLGIEILDLFQRQAVYTKFGYTFIIPN